MWFRPFRYQDKEESTGVAPYEWFHILWKLTEKFHIEFKRKVCAIDPLGKKL